jgi:hypothetical protein
MQGKARCVLALTVHGELIFASWNQIAGWLRRLDAFEDRRPSVHQGSAAKVWTDALAYAFSLVSCDRPRGSAPPFASPPQNQISPRRSKHSSRNVSLKPHSERSPC